MSQGDTEKEEANEGWTVVGPKKSKLWHECWEHEGKYMHLILDTRCI